jgi:hypothetical protein
MIKPFLKRLMCNSLAGALYFFLRSSPKRGKSCIPRVNAAVY